MRKAILLAIVTLNFGLGPIVFGSGPDLNRTLPATIRVGIRQNGKITRCEVVDFNYYVKHVLPQEWKDLYDMESLKAGAIAVKHYAWYWINRGGKFAGSSTYKDKDQPCDADVDNTEMSQVYDPKTDLQFNNYIKTDLAVDSVWDVGILQDGKLFQAEYRNNASGNNQMSQIGSNTLAKRGMTYQEILRKYYKKNKLSFFFTLPRPKNCPIQNGRNSCELFLPIAVTEPDATGCNRERQALKPKWDTSALKIINEQCVELPSVALTKDATLSSYVGVVDFAKNKYALASIKEFIQTLDAAVVKHDFAVKRSTLNYDSRLLIGQWGVSNALEKKGAKFQPQNGYNVSCYALGCAIDISLLTYRTTDPRNPNPTELNPDGKIAIPPIEDGNTLRVQEMWNVLKGLKENNDICSASNLYFDGIEDRWPHFHIERWGLGNDKCA